MHVKGIGTKQYLNMREFLNDWQPLYSYSHPDRYLNHIDHALQNRRSFNTLFLWKNGRTLSLKKQESVDRYWDKRDILNQLQSDFGWKMFESSFEPEKEACIWKLFLLHVVLPSKFPIYDQHVYRAFEFIRTGEVHEIPSNNDAKYKHFKNLYNPWFQQIKKDCGLDVKFIDEACFAFGKALQRIHKLPYQVYDK